jgi:hypothetical protein
MFLPPVYEREKPWLIDFIEKTGSGEWIRTVDPNLSNIGRGHSCRFPTIEHDVIAFIDQ